MLKSKDGIITNALLIEHNDLTRLAQDSRVDVAIRIPGEGVPLTAGTKLCMKLYVNKPLDEKGKAMKRTSVLDFTCRLFGEGVIIETIGLRKQYMEFMMNHAKNRANRQRAEREYAKFKEETARFSDDCVLWCAAVDKRGVLYVSSAGALQSDDLDYTGVEFSSGDTLAGMLNTYAGNSQDIKASIDSLNITALPNLDLSSRVSAADVKEAISLTGCLLTIRGFHAQGRSAEDVMAEWNMVAQPMLEFLPDEVFSSWDMPWSISTFRGMQMSDTDKARANVVAPYLGAAAGLFATSTSGGINVDKTRMITLFKRGQWNLVNNTYSVRLNGATIVFDSAVNGVIANGLAMSAGTLDTLALEVLKAANTYGRCMGDESSWARLLWCEWIGIYGLLGGLSINASS